MDAIWYWGILLVNAVLVGLMLSVLQQLHEHNEQLDKCERHIRILEQQWNAEREPLRPLRPQFPC